jgi:hypothetical protein
MVTQPDMRDLYDLAGYLRSMSTRMHSLHMISEELTRQVGLLNFTIGLKRDELKKEMLSVKNDVSEVKQDVREIQKSIIHMIFHLKSTVKADQLERFKKRMDLWAPESLVTRNEANKVIDEL